MDAVRGKRTHEDIGQQNSSPKKIEMLWRGVQFWWGGGVKWYWVELF